MENLLHARTAESADFDLYRTVLHQLPCGTLAILERVPETGDFVLIDANRRFADLVDMRLEDVPGRRLDDLLPRSRTGGLFDLLEDVHRTGAAKRGPVLFFDGGRVAGWRDARVFRLDETDFLVCSFPNVDILHRVIDNLSGFLGIFTPDGILIDLNAAPLELSGLARADVIGRPAWETPWVAHSREARARLRAALERAGGGEVVQESLRISPHAGQSATFQGTFSPIRGEDGKVSLVVGFGVDVTDRDLAFGELRASEKLFRTFIDNTPSLIALKSADGRFLLANKAQAEHGRIQDTDVFGKTSFEVFTPEQAALAVAHDRRVLEARDVITEERVVDGPKGRRDFLITKFPIFGDTGDVSQVGVVGTDITETKRADEAIRRNEQRIRHLEQNLARLERVSSLGTMLSGLAHELNQPLAALQVYSNRLLAIGRDWRDPPSGMVDTLAEMQRLTDLANRIMLRLRGAVEPSFSEPARIDCLEAVNEVLELVRPDLDAAGIAFVFEPPSGEIPIVANTIDLQLVLSNLIRNAREALASAEDGCIRLDIVCDEEEDMICISVTDNGPGIDDASKSRVFTPFYTTKATGMGLGLAMAQRLAEGMNGQIRIYDNTPQGAVVHLCLPRSAA